MHSGIDREVVINSKTLVVAIDLAKGKNIVYARKVQGPDAKLGEFTHRRSEYQRIYEKIMKFKEKHNCSNVLVTMESTGVYGIPLQHFLMNKPVTLVLVNPVHVKRAKEITDNSPNKSDDKDPKVMADLVQFRRFLTVVIPEGIEADLRHFTNARERALLRLDVLCNQVHDLVFEIFPEYLQIFKDMRTKTFLNLLKNYTRPIDIVSLGLDGIRDRIFKYSRGRKRDIKQVSEALYEAAKVSVGIKHGSESITFEIKSLVDQIESTQVYIKELESEISNKLHQIPYSKWLLSVPRLGKITASVIIGEFADMRSFKSIGELMKFAGLNLYEISSGKRKGNCRISKRGRTLLRKFLYYGALNMIRKGGIYHDTYKAYYRKGRMMHTEAIVAISKKLLRLIYALVRDECFYENGYKLRFEETKAA